MEKHTAKYNDWEYELLYENGSHIPTINVKPHKKPRSLSKYYSLNENNVLAFLNNEFYVSQPDQLNDLFDSNLCLINFEKLPFSYFEERLKEKPTSVIEKQRKEYYSNRKEFLQKWKRLLYYLWIQEFGILSMAENVSNEFENKQNELMWSHYTNNEGFLIEFDYTRFNSDFFIGPIQINYTDQLKPVNFKGIDDSLGFLIASSIKKDIWEYEHEYRFLCRPENGIGFKVSGTFDNSNLNQNLQRRFISYPKKSIKKIILAFAFLKNDIDYQNADYLDRKYNVIFTGKNSELKIKLFNYLIENKISVELMVFDEITFELKAIPISISKISETTYNIEEQRPQVKTKKLIS